MYKLYTCHAFLHHSVYRNELCYEVSHGIIYNNHWQQPIVLLSHSQQSQTMATEPTKSESSPLNNESVETKTLSNSVT